MIIGTTHVWLINSQLIIADTIEDAIAIFKNKYEYPANEINTIERVYNGHSKETSIAYMEIKPSLKDYRVPVDGMVDADSMVDSFSDVKCDNTITLVGDGAKGKIRDACTEDYTPFEDIPIIQTNNENKIDLEPF